MRIFSGQEIAAGTASCGGSAAAATMEAVKASGHYYPPGRAPVWWEFTFRTALAGRTAGAVRRSGFHFFEIAGGHTRGGRKWQSIVKKMRMKSLGMYMPH